MNHSSLPVQTTIREEQRGERDTRLPFAQLLRAETVTNSPSTRFINCDTWGCPLTSTPSLTLC
jgi:hypothetical protein